MRLGMISFTAGGTALLRSLAVRLEAKGVACHGYVPKRYWTDEMGAGGIEISGDGGAGRFAERMFASKTPMLFVGAAGIAVRAIAPWVRDKMSDPPVLVMDEAGRFVIPILSGHVGGANELARLIGDCCGAVPVITTATDVNHVFAVDVFAARNELAITDREAARHIAMDLLEGREVGFFDRCSAEMFGRGDDGRIFDGRLPAGWLPAGCAAKPCARNICISVEADPGFPGENLVLVPRAVVLGIGCRRGISVEALRGFVEESLKGAGIRPEAVACLASIDVKRDERAITELASEKNWKFITYPAEELERVPGEFSESAFVRQTVGVGCVCERAAMAAAPGGRLLFGKQAGSGATVAAALRPIQLRAE